MNENDLYQAIFKRKSIRNYDPAPLDQKHLAVISEYLGALKPMSPGIRTEFKIISPHQVSRKMRNRAPHFIAAFSEAKGAYKPNIGFMLQQMNLYFSAAGLGSCWLGIPRPTKEVKESSGLEFVILMSFGNSREALYRTSVSQFNRKPLSKITNIQGTDELLEPARLAPSAVNLQNWYFTGDRNLIHAYSSKPGFLGRIIGGSHFLVNVGIALCHLQLAAQHLGWKTEITFEEESDKNPPSGREYVASLAIERTQASCA